MLAATRRPRQSVSFWPAYVDSLAGLLMMMVFLSLFYVLGELVLSSSLETSRQSLTSAERALLLSRLDSEKKAQEIETLIQELSVAEMQEATLEEELDSLRSDIENLLIIQNERDSTIQELADRVTNLILLREQLMERVSLGQEEVAGLEQNLASERQHNQALQAEVAGLIGRLDLLKAIEAEQVEKLAELSNEIASLKARRNALESQLSERDVALDQSREATRSLDRKLALLNSQLERVQALLGSRDQQIAAQQARIDQLGERLNMALASEVSRLQRYRSEFLGRMREVIADHPEVKIVDDRFILPSEVLFSSSSAELSRQGRRSLAEIAGVLKDLLAEAPQDLPWILRVDGHTDARPINTERFPSNWELSAARAIAVVQFFRSLGIPAHRLAATGFADQYPVVRRFNKAAFRQNRRIEMKLTQR